MFATEWTSLFWYKIIRSGLYVQPFLFLRRFDLRPFALTPPVYRHNLIFPAIFSV